MQDKVGQRTQRCVHVFLIFFVLTWQREGYDPPSLRREWDEGSGCKGTPTSFFPPSFLLLTWLGSHQQQQPPLPPWYHTWNRARHCWMCAHFREWWIGTSFETEHMGSFLREVVVSPSPLSTTLETECMRLFSREYKFGTTIYSFSCIAFFSILEQLCSSFSNLIQACVILSAAFANRKK